MEALIRELLIRQGSLIPTSAEEVAIFEEEFEGKMEEVPESLKTPPIIENISK